MAAYIGYVPQHIYLADDTIAANIAFGEVKNKINKNMVINAAKIANLHNFVSNELPEKYQTLIGENELDYQRPTAKDWYCKSFILPQILI